MKGFRILAATAVTLLTVKSASAGILLEPVLGYGMGTYEQPVSGFIDTDMKGKSSGIYYGGRAGYGIGPVTIAADVLMAGAIKNKSDDPTWDDEDTKSRTMMGVTGVVSFPLLPIRLWLGYNFSDTVKMKDGSSIEGNGFKVGVGYTIIPMVSVNLDYITSTFGKIKNDPDFGDATLPITFDPDGVGAATDVTLDKRKTTTILVSVSAPLGF